MIKIAVIDDSAVMRQILNRIISGFEGMEIVCLIRDSLQAETRLQANEPDIVLLDIEMPGKSGLELLPDLLTLPKPPKVLIVSSTASHAARSTIQALTLGASDFIAKPSANFSTEDFVQELELKIRGLTTLADISKTPVNKPAPQLFEQASVLPTKLQTRPYQVLAIGCSTGGPKALQVLLSQLPKASKIPILITQHMSVEFTQFFAHHLNRVTGMECLLASDQDRLSPGRAYLAPGGKHMTVAQDIRGPYICLDDGPPQNFCKPSVNPMLSSLAQVYGAGVCAVILTGMGRDGLEGCQAVSAAGGAIYVQDQETSVVWGMPGAVAKAGLATSVLPLEVLTQSIAQKMSSLQDTQK